MFARIAALIAKDARTGARDQLVTYMLLAPVLLGLLLGLLLGILEGASPLFAVSEGLDPQATSALAEVGEVERLADRDAVVARVRGRDDLVGVVPGPTPASPPEVIVEGDEPLAQRGLAAAILDRAARERAGEAPVAAQLVAVGSGRPQLRLVASALLALCIVVVVGMIVGFTILEEKVSNTIAAYRSSPLRFAEYLAGKLILATLLSLILVVPALALVLGLDLAWGGVALMTLASLPFAVSLGLCVGVFARDQLGAIAVLKALLPVWTSLPILGFVLPAEWLWTQWPFANHWAAQGYFAVLSGRAGASGEAGLALATGLPVLVLAAALLRRRLGF